MSLPKVRIQEGVEEPDSIWARPGEPALLTRWWEGEASGYDPHVFRAALGLPDGPADVVLPMGRAVAYVTVDATQHLGRIDPEWRITLQGSGPSPLG
ncbi:hypothetical protein [Streptomyces goshikiensis]